MRRIALGIATVGGIGYAPGAPGTWASLAALPLVPLLAGLPGRWLAGHALVVAVVVVAGIWAAGRADAWLEVHDDGCIVVDELGGMLVGSLFVPGTWTAAVLVFVLFRVFDIWKPFPIDRIDQRWPGGLGVVCDDVVAGAYAGLLARAILEVS